MNRALLALLLAGCGPGAFCEFPDEATALPGVLAETDTCGFWSLPAGEHLYLNLHVARELPDCALSLGDSVSSPNEPIYVNLEEDGPKYTYDIVADAPIDETSVDITCDEGTQWHALLVVE